MCILDFFMGLITCNLPYYTLVQKKLNSFFKLKNNRK